VEVAGQRQVLVSDSPGWPAVGLDVFAWLRTAPICLSSEEASLDQGQQAGRRVVRLGVELVRTGDEDTE
jgi:hypothetical protein